MMQAKFQDHRTYDSEKEVFKAFYHILAWCPSWSCDIGHLYNFRSQFQRRRLKFAFDWQSGFREDLLKRWTDGWTPSRSVNYMLTISSPCEPNGSGELKMHKHEPTACNLQILPTAVSL